jgi:hypothetical protein
MVDIHGWEQARFRAAQELRHLSAHPFHFGIAKLLFVDFLKQCEGLSSAKTESNGNAFFQQQSDRA